MKKSFYILFRAANGFTYYGISLNTSNISGNPYVNCLIAGAVELPAFFCISWLFDKYGRVRSYVVAMWVAGISLIACSLVPPGNLYIHVCLYPPMFNIYQITLNII